MASRRSIIRNLAVLAALGAAGFFIAMQPATFDILRGRNIASPAATADLDNGRNLFWAGGCASCHATENQPDRTLLGGGHGLKSPFGTFYVPNISSHPRDGIGSWTFAQFARAMVQGVSPSGEHYYPSFPYPSYQRMTDKDLGDLYGFMKTLPAVEGKIRGHDLPFPFNIRLTLGGWKWLFLDGKPFQPVASASAEFNRGAYLTEGAGHCAECHSPRNLLGAIVGRHRYAGGPEAEGGDGWVPNITQAGIGSYSEDDIARMLEDGERPNGDSVGGVMGKVVGNTSKLSEADRRALAVYIKSLPAIEGPKRPK